MIQGSRTAAVVVLGVYNLKLWVVLCVSRFVFVFLYNVQPALCFNYVRSSSHILSC